MPINKQKYSKKIQIISLENKDLICNFKLPDKWLIALINIKEESPGSTRTQCQVIPGRGNPRDSATENKPP